MKKLLYLACFLAALMLANLRAADAEGIRGPTFEGVIFSPSQLPKATKSDPEPSVAAGLFPDHGVCWKPSRDLITNAEHAFAEAVIAANSKIPPGGPHYHEYYTPKFGSADRLRKLPADIYTNFIYGWDLDQLTGGKRQYIGVTAHGKKMLVMNFVFNVHYVSSNSVDDYLVKNWKHEWMYICDAGTQIFYDLDTGTFWEVDT